MRVNEIVESPKDIPYEYRPRMLMLPTRGPMKEVEKCFNSYDTTVISATEDLNLCC